MALASDRPAIVWFRRDLRLHDHPALAAALASHPSVVPLFIVDEALVRGRWPAPNRVWWMLGAVAQLRASIEARNGRLLVRSGRPEEIVRAVARDVGARDVYVSRDHAPYGRARDHRVAEALEADGGGLHARRGGLIQEPEDVRTVAGRPFTVFSPFRRAWERLPVRELLPAPDRVHFPTAGSDGRALDPGAIPTLADLGLDGPTADPALLPAPGEAAARRRLEWWLAAGPDGLDAYEARRDRLGVEGTSRLSADLRWGTLSPTEVLVRAGRPGHGPRAFASELAWREFYAHLLWHRPELRRSSFGGRGERLPWREDPPGVAAWSEGRTGFPLVDAAMRQLMASGWMPNRARMIVASFLTKDLLVDWRVGEAHFMAHLVDGDVASNNGGWQWTASTGADPQPYFRIFNPAAQGRRHDPDGAYVRRWVPELAHVPSEHIHAPWEMPSDVAAAAGCRIGIDYPAPIVDHAEARTRALAGYRAARERADRDVDRPG